MRNHEFEKGGAVVEIWEEGGGGEVFGDAANDAGPEEIDEDVELACFLLVEGETKVDLHTSCRPYIDINHCNKVAIVDVLQGLRASD
jgi:hypothetical protein